MAGSPGAGKTEYSKSFIKALQEEDPLRKIVRVDADEVRDFLPMYNKKNSDEIQSAAVIGVEKLLDQVIGKDQEFLLDATFSLYEKSYSNITRCIRHKRKVSVCYIYQDPVIAWGFYAKERST